MARGAVVIDAERCKACGLCIAACPQNLLHLAAGLNLHGYHPVEFLPPNSPTAHAPAYAPGARPAAPAASGVQAGGESARLHGGCTGCALCALVCPDVAITVWREPPPGRSEGGARAARLAHAAAGGPA
jgi:2-oxoglutarate ferredoxin oxidoreductase subunit delta